MRYQAIAVLAAGALVVAGCSTADDPDDTASPLPTAGEQTPTETPGEAVTLDDTMLLPPEQMPAWNNAGTWVEVDDTNFWRVCTLSDPQLLGATEVTGVAYEYVVELDEGETADPDAEPMLGGNVLASFDDEAAATAAIDAWRAELAACSDVGEITQLDTGVTWTGNDLDEATGLSWFDFTGIAAKGATTTIVGFSLQGQDANFESDPLEQSMSDSLARLP
ncbi:MAG: hypothetical protein WCA82_08340 [Jiangellales bacterium]